MRPVAIGEVLLRLLGRLCSKAPAPKCAPCFDLTQFGVGIRVGVEIVAHQTKALIEEPNTECMVQIDANNAFNRIDRSATLAALRKHFPEVYNYLLPRMDAQRPS